MVFICKRSTTRNCSLTFESTKISQTFTAAQERIVTTRLIGKLPGYGTVSRYDANGVANILSLTRMKEQGYRVTYDSQIGNAFHVHKSDGTEQVINESDEGRYCMDINNHENEIGATLINTVEDNRVKYSQYDYSKAL